MDNFINWGHESPDQIEQRRKLESDLYEMALMRTFEARQAGQSAAAAASGGGGGQSADPLAGTGSITFNGTNQYVRAPRAQVDNWLPGTGEYTIEWFIKKGVGGGGAPRVFSLGYDTGATIGCSIESGTCYIWPYSGPFLSGTTTAGYEAGTDWMHVAVSRVGTTTRLFINGVLKVTRLNDTLDLSTTKNLGYDLIMGSDKPSAGNWWAGSMTNFRWVNRGLYSAAFDPITVPLTNVADTKLLMLGGTLADPVRDSAGLNTLENNGGVWSSATPFA